MAKTKVSEFEQLMSEVASGSEDAVWKLAETYTPYILRAVRESLSPQMRRRLDSQDLAQTLWASVLLRRDELTRLKTPAELIAFLARAAKNRTIDARRYHLGTQKCNMDRELSLEPFTSDDEERPVARPIENRALYSREPSPSQYASIREQWGQVMDRASERDRRIMQMRLQGVTFDTIRDRLHIDERTARRAIEHLVSQFSK